MTRRAEQLLVVLSRSVTQSDALPVEKYVIAPLSWLIVALAFIGVFD